ncbi:MAG: DUF3899 domain-containing protein [Peptococcaceae bacterium]|jgi:hypothetical protein|nr:DUF3899 domain-containing protein [Peptococcaceae bacterium]
MLLKELKGQKKTIAALILIGCAAALWPGKTGWSGALPVAGSRFVSDLFFTIAMIFLAYGLWALIGNLGMFNSFIYGAKYLTRIVRNQKADPQGKGDGYLDYARSRRKRPGVPVILLFAACFMSLSVLALFLPI